MSMDGFIVGFVVGIISILCVAVIWGHDAREKTSKNP